MDEPQHRPDWNPAVSQPGEIFTVEGQIASAGAFARGLAARDARTRAYRREALRVALGWVTAGAILAFVAIVLTTLL